MTADPFGPFIYASNGAARNRHRPQKHLALGLAAFPRELWRETPLGKTFTTHMWLAPAAERPTEPDAQVAWIYDWWKRLDEWIDEQGREP